MPDDAHAVDPHIGEAVVLERIEHDRAIFATMLGGPDRETLFLMAAEWRGTEQVDAAVAARTGQILITRAPVAGAGWP